MITKRPRKYVKVGWKDNCRINQRDAEVYGEYDKWSPQEDEEKFG